MTWAERVGDLATSVALVLINLARVVTYLVRIAADKLDDFVTGLAERSEGGISRSAQPTTRVWVGIIAQVAWGIAAIVLRTASVITVFVRQAATTVDEFFRALAEESGPPTTPPSPGM
jgi:hypothetical protein